MSETKRLLSFKEAVAATEEIKNCYHPGLKAFGVYSSKIELGDPTKCEGSVDIDACVVKLYPTSNRWDYAFSYKAEVYFIEVHSAHSSQVSVMLRKLLWLKDWLHKKAPIIDALKVKNGTPFYWIQSGKFDIPKNSSQFRQAAQAKIKPVSKLKLP